MTQYLLSIYQPDTGTPPPEVLEKVMRDVNAQRRTDLVNIDRMLGFVQDKVGVEVMKDRQRLDLLYRASQRQ